MAMKKRAPYILLMLLLLTGKMVGAQIVVSENIDDNKAGVHGVVVHADPRLDVILKKNKSMLTGGIRSGQGYRVQIYNGNDRNKATEIKVDFMRRFPGIRTYMTYVQPQFRVKVGDYRTRAEAEKVYEQVSTLYNACMIVPDIIVVNTLKDD